ncbi:MAG TPA: methyltransferase domain-containing protein [Solirubrobacteraceae bacterium]
MAPAVAAAVDDVLAAAGVPDPSQLPPPQRAMVAAYVRSAFGQSTDMLAAPAKLSWEYTDPAVLEGQGRGSMMMPTFMNQTGEIGEVSSFLDVGTGVGWLAVGATQVWPDCTVVGIDTWEPALERARNNVAEAGVADRIELRNQSVVDLDDRDRFDLTWVPSFFLPRDAVAVAVERILAATRPGGQVVIARYDPPPDPLAEAALRMRTVRDGGSWLLPDEIVGILEDAGWADIRVLRKPLAFVAGRKR